MAKPPRQSGRKVTFTPEAAQRIARAVVPDEKGDRSIEAAGRQDRKDDEPGDKKCPQQVVDEQAC